MSSNRLLIDNPGGSDTTTESEELALEELSDFGTTEPTIESIDGDVQLQPPVVTRLNGILPWDNAVDQGPCGDTQVSQSGDRNWRVTIEGILFFRHLSTLQELKRSGSDVRVLAPMTSELGMERVNFDRVELERRSELNDQRVTFDDKIINEPIYEFQFQNKENTDE